MLKVFITGSEGFVGQHVIRLFKENFYCIGLNLNSPLEAEKNVEYVVGNILDQDLILHILQKYQPDVILHLAGIAKTWGSDSEEVFKINLSGTFNIYQAIITLKQKNNFNPKIIFISSAEVYGKTTQTENITENNPLFPINIYGVSKLAADRLSYMYSQTEKLKIIIIRPFPHIGPGQQKGFFVSDMASQIAEAEKNPQKKEILVGNLEAVRDYLDVRDVANAYKLAIEKDLPFGEVYNLCSGKGVKTGDILQTLLKLSTKKLTIKKDPHKLRSIDLKVYVGNNKKFMAATSWQPKFEVDQTLKDVLDYWRGR